MSDNNTDEGDRPRQIDDRQIDDPLPSRKSLDVFDTVLASPFAAGSVDTIGIGGAMFGSSSDTEDRNPPGTMTDGPLAPHDTTSQASEGGADLHGASLSLRTPRLGEYGDDVRSGADKVKEDLYGAWVTNQDVTEHGQRQALGIDTDVIPGTMAWEELNRKGEAEQAIKDLSAQKQTLGPVAEMDDAQKAAYIANMTVKPEESAGLQAWGADPKQPETQPSDPSTVATALPTTPGTGEPDKDTSQLPTAPRGTEPDKDVTPLPTDPRGTGEPDKDVTQLPDSPPDDAVPPGDPDATPLPTTPGGAGEPDDTTPLPANPDQPDQPDNSGSQGSTGGTGTDGGSTTTGTGTDGGSTTSGTDGGSTTTGNTDGTTTGTTESGSTDTGEEDSGSASPDSPWEGDSSEGAQAQAALHDHVISAIGVDPFAMTDTAPVDVGGLQRGGDPNEGEATAPAAHSSGGTFLTGMQGGALDGEPTLSQPHAFDASAFSPQVAPGASDPEGSLGAGFESGAQDGTPSAPTSSPEGGTTDGTDPIHHKG